LLVEQINGIIIEILETGSVFSGSLKSEFKRQQIFLISLFSQPPQKKLLPHRQTTLQLPRFPASQLPSFPLLMPLSPLRGKFQIPNYKLQTKRCPLGLLLTPSAILPAPVTCTCHLKN
jgi:hypothetical protein